MSGGDTAVFGELELAEGTIDRFLALVVDPARRDDWGDTLTSCDFKPATAGELIAWIRRELAEPYFRIDVDEAGRRITVRGMLPDDDFLSYGAGVAELFRVGSEVGARGEMTFVGYLTSPHAFRVEVSPEGSSVRRLSDEEREAAEASEGYKEVDAAVMAAVGL